MGTDENEVFASLLLNSLPSLGPRAFAELVRQFGSAAEALRQGPPEWQSDQLRRDCEADLELMSRHNARVYLAHMGAYPALLKTIFSPPPVIYAMGEDIGGDRLAVAIVGSRRSSYYGEKMARAIAGGLASHAITVVSGLARGIDTEAHRAALEARGRTWAVIGTGLGVVYPPENKKLAAAIAAQGAVISEFPMSTRPFPANFPRRNRIIAGLTQGTVVVEGGIKSGALITARLAAHEGRDVFAVPGPVTSELSATPHLLLKDGAGLAESAADVAAALGLSWPEAAAQMGQKIKSKEEESVLASLGGTPVSKEALSVRLKMDAETLAALLIMMEIKGLIRSGPGGVVMKA